jgi:hypothetical protein
VKLKSGLVDFGVQISLTLVFSLPVRIEGPLFKFWGILPGMTGMECDIGLKEAEL